MVKRIILIGAILAIGLSQGKSQDRGFGLGVMLGEPTGINGKLWTSSVNAFDGGLAWSFRGDGFFHIHADYLWHFPHTIQSTERFVLYTGVGARLGTGSDNVFGVRIPVGIEWWPKDTPLDVFLELAPIVNLAPATDFDMDGFVGIRFFFE